MEPVDPEQLEDWLSERLREPPPPAYRLAVPRESAEPGRSRQAEALEKLGAEVLGVDDRSGAIRFVLPGPRSDVAEVHGELLFAACQQADEREYFWADWADGGEASGPEVRSRIPGTGMSVLGPGGGVLLVAGAGDLRGELTVRRRTDEWQAEGWDSISRLSDRLGALADGEANLFVEIGYFEASNREEQDLLRPVLLAVAEHEANPEREFDVGWRRLLVEPVTDLTGISREAGIGLWYESEGGIRG